MPAPAIKRPAQRAPQMQIMAASSMHPIWAHSIHWKMLAIDDTTPLDMDHMVLFFLLFIHFYIFIFYFFYFSIFGLETFSRNSSFLHSPISLKLLQALFVNLKQKKTFFEF